MSVNRKEIDELIKRYKSMEIVDSKLVNQIIDKLHLRDVVDLTLILKKTDKRERIAAIEMVESQIDGLLSSDKTVFLNAKKILHELYSNVEGDMEDA
jgi:hypothetical protein